MSNQVQAIQKELSRVRKLKRASEAEVELLRSDMERGKIHIRINEDIKDDLAEALVKIYELSYDSNINTNYYTDGESIFKISPGNYNVPYDVDWKTIPVINILDGNNQRYFSWDEWDYSDLKDIIDTQYWAEMEENDDYEDIVYFLQEEHPDVYDEIISEQRDLAKEYFLGEIPDEYVVWVNES